jgi:hypothetical protein
MKKQLHGMKEIRNEKLQLGFVKTQALALKEIAT